jgi:hypothetical protein
MSSFTIVRAPAVSRPSIGSTSSGVSRLSNTNNATIGVSVGSANTPQTVPRNSVPLVSASGPGVTVNRDLSLNISRPSIAVATPAGIASSLGIPTSPSGVASALGVPTTVGGALSQAGLPTALPPLNEALQTLGIPTSFSATIQLTGLEFPKIPGFPGIDLIGINLGAGKKFIAEQIAKYKLIIPPFAPGLKINMGVALAALSVIKAAAEVGPGELIKHLLSNIVDDLKQQVQDQLADQLQQAIDSTGINDLQANVNLTLGSAQDSFVDQYNANNPPQTIVNEDGETVVIAPPPPDVSQFSQVNLAPEKKETPSIGVSLSADNFKSKTTTNVVAFTFPPKG